MPRDEADVLRDWAFIYGDWTVKHERLGRRLAGCTEWETFAGTSSTRPTMGGFGNVEDNFLALPAGPYRAVAIRAYDGSRDTWSIWWIDQRTANVDPPVRGGFEGDVGTFFGDDVVDGRPVRVRFTWRKDGPDVARWEQAFSDDDGTTWETNWRMTFTRRADARA